MAERKANIAIAVQHGNGKTDNRTFNVDFAGWRVRRGQGGGGGGGGKWVVAVAGPRLPLKALFDGCPGCWRCSVARWVGCPWWKVLAR